MADFSPVKGNHPSDTDRRELLCSERCAAAAGESVKAREAPSLCGHGDEIFQRRMDVGKEMEFPTPQAEEPVGAEGLHQALGGGE